MTVIGIRTDSIILVGKVRATIKGNHGARRIALNKGARVKLRVNIIAINIISGVSKIFLLSCIVTLIYMMQSKIIFCSKSN